MSDAPTPHSLPPLQNDRALADSLRCGSCRKSEWHNNYKTLWCRPRGHVVSPVKNFCEWHRYGGDDPP